MTLSLFTAALMLSALGDVRGQGALPQQNLISIKEICSKIQASATKLNQHFISCEIGQCVAGVAGKTVANCAPDEVKIAFKVELDGNTLCTERCVKKDGAAKNGGASTSNSQDAGAQHDGMEDKGMAPLQGKEESSMTHDGAKMDASPDSMPAHDGMATDGKMMPTDGKMMPKDGKMMPTDGKMMPKDGKMTMGGKTKTASVPKGGAMMPTASVDVAAAPVDAGDAMGDTEAMPIAAEAPLTDAAMAPMTCNNIVEALMKLPQAAGLAEFAPKVLEPETMAILTNPAANLTIFVPPQEALLKLIGGFQTGAITQADVATILKLHMVTDVLLGVDLVTFEGESLPTLAGAEDLMVSIEGDKVALMANNTVMIVEEDLDGCTDTQVIHTIDGLLLPDGIELDLAALPAGDLGAVSALAPVGAGGERGVAPPAPYTGAAASLMGSVSALVGVALIAIFA